MRTKIDQTFFVPSPLPWPQAHELGQFEGEPGILADRVTYATEFGMRVPAIVFGEPAPASSF